MSAADGMEWEEGVVRGFHAVFAKWHCCAKNGGVYQMQEPKDGRTLIELRVERLRLEWLRD